jgi:hypothetical protein
MLDYYMRARYPQYINKISLSETEMHALTIFSHIVREEYAWYYNAQDLNDRSAPANNNP